MKQISLYYDDECPFCREYSKYIELRQQYEVDIINAREATETINNFRDKGFDINEGMIVEFDSKIYQGADAARILDNCISKNKFIDKFISFFVQIPGFKSIIYPVVKFIRVVLLKIMGKNPDIKY